MAQSLARRILEPQPGRKPPALRLVEGDIKTDFEAEPGKPTLGIHPAPIALAMVAVVVFLAASMLFLSGNLGSDLNIYGVAGFAVIFFSLTLGLARRAAQDPRWGGAGHASLREFANDNVSIATGVISGKEALVQIVVLPATLAAGMVVIGLIYALGW